MNGFDFRGRRVLVAGGTGLIGIPLVRALIEEEGAEVRIASLDHPSRAHPAADFRKADLLRYDCCQWACVEMDYVFNLLCVKGSPKTMCEKPATMFDINLLLDVNLLRAAKAAGVQGYLLASSLAVYAQGQNLEDSVWENTYPSRNDWYAGWAKRMGELQAGAYANEYGWDGISIVRPTNTYGPYDDFESEAAMVVPSLIRRVVSGEDPLRVWGDGSEIRDFLFAEDVARGMILVAKLGEQKPVNLGSGIGVSIRELVSMIVACAEARCQIEWDISQKAGDHKRVLNTERARALGFRPRISLKDGIRKTVEWYRTHREESTRFNFFSEKR